MVSAKAGTSEVLKETADTFLNIAHEFKLGSLPTESPNSKTTDLSNLAKNDLIKALEIFKDVDCDALKVLVSKKHELLELKKQIRETLQSGGRIFLCGCGATGRLSLALETIWRMHFQNEKGLREKVVSFMAGGDVALIHSIEKFEDFPEFGARQLRENHFYENDLLIATTEGGETPWVIGATEFASRYGKRKPYFLYCNPDDILKSVATRSRNVIENSKIQKINLTVGPMALTGSTRLQASTILMAFVGFALIYHNESDDICFSQLEKLCQFHENLDYGFLKEFTEKEAQHYQSGGTILYETDPRWAISILTDTTERSPTFSLHSFENQNDGEKTPSLVYLYLKEALSEKEAWRQLLQRTPRTFYWEELTKQTSYERLVGFKFHCELFNLRKKYLKKPDEIFFIKGDKEITFEFLNSKKSLDLKNIDLLSQHLILKMLLNAHSTLIMGRLERFEGNLMTWVRPSNFKLIDRAVRYASILLKHRGKTVDYEKLVRDCYELKDIISRNDPIVIKIVEKNLN